MIFFKLIFLCLLLIDKLDTKKTINFSIDEKWDKILINELPEKDRSLSFFSIKNVDKFELKLNRNPFVNLMFFSDDLINPNQTVSPFKIIFFNIKFWSKFDEQLYSNLISKLEICGDQFSWPIKNLKKESILKIFNETYIKSKKDDITCIANFKFSIINPPSNGSSNNSSSETFKIDEINVLQLGLYYSTISIDLSFLHSDDITSNLNFSKIWNTILDKYERLKKNNVSIDAPIHYGCEKKACDSFLINSQKIDHWSFYPKANREWEYFYLTSNNSQRFSLKIDQNLSMISNYKIEFFYYATDSMKLKVFTSLSENSLIELYPTHSYSPGPDLNKFLPINIVLKDLVPFKIDSVESNFTIYIQTKIKENNSTQIAAISNIKIISGYKFKPDLTDFLYSWITNGKKARNDWTCLVDGTSFYKGQENDDLNSNIIISLFAPKFRSNSTYLMLSKWFNSSNQSIEIVLFNDLSTDSSLLIETIDENLNVINSDLLKFSNFDSLSFTYDVLKKNKTSNVQFLIVRLRLSFLLNNNEDDESKPKKIVIRNIEMGDPCGRKSRCVFSKECISKSSTDFDCNCLPNYYGKLCNWPNQCLIDPDHCKNQNATCIPILDKFKCVCNEKDKFWMNERKECQYLPDCYRKKGLIDNQCVYEYNYEYKYDYNKNNTFTCNHLYEVNSYINSCIEFNYDYGISCDQEREKAVVSLLTTPSHRIASFCKCNIDNGFLRNESPQQTCIQIKSSQTQIPLLKQYLNCSQSYSLVEVDLSNATTLLPTTIEKGNSSDKQDVATFTTTSSSLLTTIEESSKQKTSRTMLSSTTIINGSSNKETFTSFSSETPKQTKILLSTQATQQSTGVKSSFRALNLETNSKLKCSCLNGFKFDDNHNCVPKQKCNLKCNENQFCAFDNNNQQICKCELGFSGENCTLNFCDLSENKQIIKNFCGDYGCKVRKESPKFVCNCDERIYEVDSKTGLCRIKDVCSLGSKNYLDCKSKGSVCMPFLNEENVLTYTCRCAFGYKEDSITGECIETCSYLGYYEFMNMKCYPDSISDVPIETCKPGFQSEEKNCILSENENKFEATFEARINVNRKIYYDFNRIKNVQLNLTNLNCEKLVDDEGCVQLMNRSYLELEELSDQLIINKSFKYSFAHLISLSFQSVLGDDLDNLIVLNYELIDNFSKFVESTTESVKSTTKDVKITTASPKITTTSSKITTKSSNITTVSVKSTTASSKNKTASSKNKTASEKMRLLQRSNQSDLINADITDWTKIYKEPYIKVMKFRIYFETKGFFNLNDNYSQIFLNDCVNPICPLYPYLNVAKKTFQIKKLKLRETDYLTDCFPNSSPVYEENSNIFYRCACDEGYKSLFKILLSSNSKYFKEICYDRNECLEDTHKCNNETTVCVNEIGGYRCDCKTNEMIRKDKYNCAQSTNLCDSGTTSYLKFNRTYDCKCKDEKLIKKDEFSCFDPCLNVDECKPGKCLPYKSSYICSYEKDLNKNVTDKKEIKNSSSSVHLSIIILFIWIYLNFINLI